MFENVFKDYSRKKFDNYIYNQSHLVSDDKMISNACMLQVDPKKYTPAALDDKNFLERGSFALFNNFSNRKESFTFLDDEWVIETQDSVSNKKTAIKSGVLHIVVKPNPYLDVKKFKYDLKDAYQEIYLTHFLRFYIACIYNIDSYWSYNSVSITPYFIEDVSSNFKASDNGYLKVGLDIVVKLYKEKNVLASNTPYQSVTTKNESIVEDGVMFNYNITMIDKHFSSYSYCQIILTVPDEDNFAFSNISFYNLYRNIIKPTILRYCAPFFHLYSVDRLEDELLDLGEFFCNSKISVSSTDNSFIISIVLAPSKIIIGSDKDIHDIEFLNDKSFIMSPILELDGYLKNANISTLSLQTILENILSNTDNQVLIKNIVEDGNMSYYNKNVWVYCEYQYLVATPNLHLNKELYDTTIVDQVNTIPQYYKYIPLVGDLVTLWLPKNQPIVITRNINGVAKTFKYIGFITVTKLAIDEKEFIETINNECKALLDVYREYLSDEIINKLQSLFNSNRIDNLPNIYCGLIFDRYAIIEDPYYNSEKSSNKEESKKKGKGWFS